MLGAGIQLGITIGIVLAYWLGSIMTWQNLALCSCFFAVLQLSQSMRIPETPRYLLMRDRKQEALQSLAWLRGPVADIDEECRDIEENLPDKNDKFTLGDLFSQPQLLAPLKVSAGLIVFQQLTGINVVMFYTVSIFNGAGFVNGEMATIAVGVVQVVFTLIACLLIDKYGRRLLLVVAGCGMAGSCFALGFYYFMADPSAASLALFSVIFYIIFFSLGWGPIPMLVMSEVFPVNARGAASAVSTACAWTVSYIVTSQFQQLQTVFGPDGSFFIFGGFCVLGTFFVLKMVPETKGKSLEDIELHFMGKASMRR